jgi:hypothetical protein
MPLISRGFRRASTVRCRLGEPAAWPVRDPDFPIFRPARHAHVTQALELLNHQPARRPKEIDTEAIS